MPSAAPLMLPSITLPKGGGAIAAIGEKFSVSPSSGTGTFTVPVSLSPGRYGFGPSLTLGYDSGAGNGVFGLGWNVSLPRITRKTSKGLPRYADDAESDVYIVSDAEDLVPELSQSGAAPHLLDTGAFVVTRYRPRIEGAYSRIERWRDKTTAEVHWQVTTTKNVRSVFGRSANARIADPHDPLRVFTWLLEETSDDRGNLIAYTYKQENLDGVPPDLSAEKTRLRDGNGLQNRYLKQIDYGNRFPNDRSSWCFTAVLDYGEHDLAVPTLEQAGTWSMRADPFSSFRSTFELRTYRLCRRILMFHNFPELGDTPCLVGSTDLTYRADPSATYLTAITKTGYIRNPSDKSYALTDPVTQKVRSPLSYPPIELGYTEATIDDTVRQLDPASLENLPAGLDEPRYRWIDLDGEGLSGILTEQSGAWFYKRNLGGRFGALERVGTKPVMKPLGAGPALQDFAGNGRLAVVDYEHPLPGFYERSADGSSWEPFKPFAALPQIDFHDPNVVFVDLDGDGIPDVLVTEHEVMRWYPSLGADGFAPSRTVPTPFDEDAGPAVVFADTTQSLHLADMTGDGLQDLVRIRNGEIVYWPNLGFGRFGAKIVMDGAPVFDYPDEFAQTRIRIGDVTGSGTADIVYVGADGAALYVNQAGNSWSAGRVFRTFPAVDDRTSVKLVDLFGNGTPCLVWSSPLPERSGTQLQYIDLMGRTKPHLLVSVDNNLGARTAVTYAPSTRFYVQDRLDGRPWATKLPFPVYVVSHVEHFDAVMKTKVAGDYAFHHGYYDRVEREFCGFGMVEQWDTQSFDKFSGTGLFTEVPKTIGNEFFLPPVHTKTWYHTGAFLDGAAISQYMAGEYYRGDVKAALLPDSVIVATDGSAVAPDELADEDLREACRALKGTVLRQEIYADDGTLAAPHPYAVSDYTYAVVMLQPRASNAHGVFTAHEREKLEYTYERDPSDPQISHCFTLELDAYGNTTKAATIAYPRRTPSVPPAESEQLQVLATGIEHRYANVADQPDWYRIGLPVMSSGYELTGIPLGTPPLYRYDEVLTALLGAEIPFEVTPDDVTPQRRLTERSRTLYRKNDLSGALPLESVESRAIVDQTFRMALTPGLIAAVYKSNVAPGERAALFGAEGRYQADPDGTWWAPSARAFYSPDPSAPDLTFAQEHFFLAQGLVDPFGHSVTVAYDANDLLPASTTDAVGNVVLAAADYRVLQPAISTDENLNQTALRYDALGHVIAIAVMGKAAGDGDTPDDPTARTEYDLFNWRDRGLPVYSHQFARERHGASNTRWQESYHYSNGTGHEILTKMQAEPGIAPLRDTSGKLQHVGGSPVFGFTNTRWCGNGRSVLDNKGNVVKQYEPFFDSRPDYEDEDELVEWGVTSINRYDPLGRLIRTDHPDGTLARTVFTTWHSEFWDQNDTVLESAWHQARSVLPATDPQRQADDAAVRHANTPGIAYADALNRHFMTVADDGTSKPPTRCVFDIGGQQRAVVDPLGRTAATFDHDMLGNVIHRTSIDSGERWFAFNVAAKGIRLWDGADRIVRTTYDPLLRVLDTIVKQGAAPEIVAERTTYGEDALNAVARNLRKRVAEQRDGAGVVENVEFDFKGNPLVSTRQLLTAYSALVDWSMPLPLDLEVFTNTCSFDALNRVTTATTMDGSVVTSTYNEAGSVERIDVALPGEATTSYVTNVDYNARGQRELIAYGNATTTTSTYDPETFRLVRFTTKAGDGRVLQNLSYTYDPIGNVTHIRDSAQQTLYFDNAVVAPVATFTYDPTYRLTEATGREHIGQRGPPQSDWDDAARSGLPQPGDVNAMRAYGESYGYDDAGNLLSLVHTATGGSWQRTYDYTGAGPPDNRLRSTSLPGAAGPPPFAAQYTYDPHGNTLSMPNVARLGWDHADRVRECDLQGGGTAYYAYDGQGQRVRKVCEKSATLVDERMYLGGCEIFRRRVSGTLTVERKTLHVHDGMHSAAIVDRTTIDVADSSVPPVLVRYQYSNHLGSCSLECDDAAKIVSYEEYYPFGGTSYQAARSTTEAKLKRYRFVGKERDEETGLYYCGARYYASWLGRWISCDPAGMADAPSLYVYCRNNPVMLSDPSGMLSGLEGMLDDVFNHPVATGFVNNMSGRGKALVAGLVSKVSDTLVTKAAQHREIVEKIVQGDVVGAAVRHGEHVVKELVDEVTGTVTGAAHLVKSVVKAGIVVECYPAQIGEPGADKELGSAIADLVIDGPQLVFMIDGAAGAAKGPRPRPRSGPVPKGPLPKLRAIPGAVEIVLDDALDLRLEHLLKAGESMTWVAGDAEALATYKTASAAVKSTGIGRKAFDATRKAWNKLMDLGGPVHHWFFVKEFPGLATAAENLYLTPKGLYSRLHAHYHVHRAMGFSGRMEWGAGMREIQSMYNFTNANNVRGGVMHLLPPVGP